MRSARRRSAADDADAGEPEARAAAGPRDGLRRRAGDPRLVRHHESRRRRRASATTSKRSSRSCAARRCAASSASRRRPPSVPRHVRSQGRGRVRRARLRADDAAGAGREPRQEVGAGPTGSGPKHQKYTWKTAPADMLRNRTCGRAVKSVFQDVVFGMRRRTSSTTSQAAERMDRRRAAAVSSPSLIHRRAPRPRRAPPTSGSSSTTAAPPATSPPTSSTPSSCTTTRRRRQR
jgi:hypothetical protein